MKINRAYWIDYIKRLVNRDYRPEPTVNENGLPPVFQKVKPKIEEVKLESPRFNHLIDSLVIPTIKPGKSFRDLLFEFIDARAIDEVKLYQNLNISRSIFSKIRSRQDYQPDRDNAFRFAIGLRLNLDEAIALISAAGFNFKVSSKRDLVIKHCIENGLYETMLVDSILVSCEVETIFSVK